jgi:hypothetical protein
VALINTEVKLANQYLQDFPTDGGITDLVIISPTGTPGTRTVTYYDRDDVFFCSCGADEQSFKARVDPNLLDTTSGQVGKFTSPVDNAANSSFFVGDYSPSEGSQRLFQTVSPGNADFDEINPSDPSLLIGANAFDNIQANGNDTGASASSEGYFQQVQEVLDWIFFPDIDKAICVSPRLFWNALNNDWVIVEVTLSTGLAEPLGVPGRYAVGSGPLNAGQVFGEADIRMRSGQFLADDDSTHNEPKGRLLFSSTALTGTPDRTYVRINEYNPTGKAASGGEPERIHLREILFSRIEYQDSTVPTGSPPTPIDACAESVSSMRYSPVLFTTAGSERLQLVASDGNGLTGTTTLTHYSLGATATQLSVPSPLGEPQTNRLVAYQTEVQGSLGEKIANAQVSFSVARLSTVAEVLATTPTPGETVVVAHFPIDRTDVAYDNFDVFEDGIALVEGGGNDYTVTEANGEIHFISPKPLGAGEVYTATYPHPAASAEPAHGTLVDVEAFTNTDGVAQSRVSYPDDDTLEGELDQVTASTPT